MASGPPANSRCAVLQQWLLADGAPTQRAVGALGDPPSSFLGALGCRAGDRAGSLKGDQELGWAPKRKRGPGGWSGEKRVSVRGQCGGPCPWRQAGVWWDTGGSRVGPCLTSLPCWSGALGHRFAQLRGEQVEDETVEAGALAQAKGAGDGVLPTAGDGTAGVTPPDSSRAEGRACPKTALGGAGRPGWSLGVRSSVGPTRD